MGEWDDLAKALNDFVEWADDFFEEEREREEIEIEYPVKKDGSPDMRFKINQELFGEEYKPSPEVLTGAFSEEVEEEEEEEEEEKEKWYAYYWTLEGGYEGSVFHRADSGVYYSNEDDQEWEVYDRVIEDFGARYYGGQGFEVEPSVDSPFEVEKDEVDDYEIL